MIGRDLGRERETGEDIKSGSNRKYAGWGWLDHIFLIHPVEFSARNTISFHAFPGLDNAFISIQLSTSMIQHSIDWPKLEISDPRWERDGLRFLTVKTAHLQGRGDIVLFVPQLCGMKQVPIAILLHGIYGSSWAWAMKGAAHLTAARMITTGEVPPMVLAMPSDGLWGDGTAYLAHTRADYEAWIVADVPAAVQRVVPETHGGPLFLAGLSMGGYGALRLGAKHGRDQFAAISAHSPGTSLDDLFEFVTESREDYAGVIGSQSVLDQIFADRNHLPPLRFDCGSEDVLLEKSRSLSKSLHAIRIPHTYDEFPGGHTWDYWREHLADSLRFFAATTGK